ncbi:Nudix family hydrolase [Nitrosovibrio tenuis]|uniref:8-oxo-dGTP diphosphatase n=1 Tax=Nitrosovibrio tenuis TaxID=1233 RepID=A0A1H7KR45_9PROT|nr:Nudix family hydrolase [Nitrosovibrio tenuis]SEK89281.1 8-oxo-dGTP diphosphatase [Nitrosovibrio tenuis]
MPLHSPIVEVAVAIINRADGAFLLASRPEGKPYAGYWEFPGGKVKPGEPLLHALGRELLEELGITVVQAYRWITRTFSYPHATVRLCFFRVIKWHGEPRPMESQELSWQFWNNVEVEPVLPANAPVLRALGLPTQYAITNAGETGLKGALTQVERALQGGIRLLQVREKEMDRKALRDFTRKIVTLAHHHGAKVLVNGDGDTGGVQSCSNFCQETGADGIHLPSSELMNLATRPDTDWCGASCHNAEELFRAEQLNMDFAVLGPVLPTLSHPGSSTLGWRKFDTLIRNCSIPVFALGGLRPEDLSTTWEHGGHGIAMMRGIRA